MTGIEVVEYMMENAGKGVTLRKLQVCSEMYRQLETECAPKTPSEYFGIEIVIDTKLDDPDYRKQGGPPLQ